MSELNEFAAEVLKRASAQAEAAEVFAYRTLGTPLSVDYENNKLKTIESESVTGLALRVIKDGKIGFASTTKLDAADQLVESAMATAPFGSEAVTGFAKPQDLPAVRTYSEAVQDLELEQLVQEGRQLMDALRDLDDDLLASSGVSRNAHEVLLVNSSGLDASYQATAYSASLSAEHVEGDNMLNVYEWSSSRDKDLDLKGMQDRLREQFQVARKNVSIDSGAYPVIVAPQALGDVLRPVIASTNGQAVLKGMSPWKDRLGDKVASANFSVIDDATLDYGTGTSPFDDEGTPAQRTPLVENGVLKNFYTDLKTAHRLELKPTGNGSRGGVTSPPSPSTSNLVVAAGDTPLADLIAGIEEGVIIFNTMGAWAGNPYAGEVSGTISLGLKIEHGELVGRVKNTVFSLNSFQALKDQLVGLSRERLHLGGSTAPYMLFKDVDLAGQRGGSA